MFNPSLCFSPERTFTPDGTFACEKRREFRNHLSFLVFSSSGESAFANQFCAEEPSSRQKQ
jgi:hypothetical protein